MAICARGFEGGSGEELPPTELSVSRSVLMDALYAAKLEYDRMRAEISAASAMREELRDRVQSGSRHIDGGRAMNDPASNRTHAEQEDAIAHLAGEVAVLVRQRRLAEDQRDQALARAEAAEISAARNPSRPGARGMIFQPQQPPPDGYECLVSTNGGKLWEHRKYVAAHGGWIAPAGSLVYADQGLAFAPLPGHEGDRP